MYGPLRPPCSESEFSERMFDVALCDTSLGLCSQAHRQTDRALLQLEPQAAMTALLRIHQCR